MLSTICIRIPTLTYYLKAPKTKSMSLCSNIIKILVPKISFKSTIIEFIVSLPFHETIFPFIALNPTV